MAATIFYPADAATRRDVLLVLAHGAGAGQTSAWMVRYAHGLAARGLDIVTFDFPYIQAGRKAPDRAPVLEDAFRAVIADAVGHLPAPPRRLLIGGKSMGGRMATHLAAQADQWPASAPPLHGVVVFGYPLNPPGGPSKASPDRVSHLFRITVPTLIVQGTKDNFGGPDAITAALAGGPASPIRVHGIDGGDHSLALRRKGQSADEEVWDVVAAFAST